MNKKIICLIDSLSMGGGAERQMAGLAGFLHAKGYDVALVTYHQHDENERLKEMYGIQSVILDCGEGQWNKIKAVKRYVNSFQPDVVIAYKDGATMLACILKLLGMKAKLIVSERNTTTILNKRERLKFFLYRFGDYIVPNSFAQGKFIKEQYPKLYKKVRVITNFTDTQHFSPLANHEMKEGGVLHILVTARIAPQKNIKSFMRVAKRLQEANVPVKIDWYGSVYVGMEGYGREIATLYKDLDITKVFSFHEATKNIVDAYRACDVFCLPSFYEGYPNVVCEAMSCGKAIVCSRVCDNPLIVEEEKNAFLFDPQDENDMFETIKRVAELGNDKLYMMGRGSRVIAENKFSSDAFVQKYINLIDANGEV